jgi:hypothetical protein
VLLAVKNMGGEFLALSTPEEKCIDFPEQKYG